MVLISQAIAGAASAEKATASNAGDLAAAPAEATQPNQEISASQTAQLADRDVTKLAIPPLPRRLLLNCLPMV